jgi:hypothetical protein
VPAFVWGMSYIAQHLPRLADPRWYQILVLSLLLSYGIGVLDFGIRWQNAIAIFATAQLVQFIGMRFLAQSRFDPLSALITSFSLTLLLRTDVIGLAILAAVIAIGSKFLIRVHANMYSIPPMSLWFA